MILKLIKKLEGSKPSPQSNVPSPTTLSKRMSFQSMRTWFYFSKLIELSLMNFDYICNPYHPIKSILLNY